MASDVYRNVGNCHGCAKAGTTSKHKRHLQLFPSMGPLEFFAMDIMGPLAKKTKGNEHVVIIFNGT